MVLEGSLQQIIAAIACCKLCCRQLQSPPARWRSPAYGACPSRERPANHDSPALWRCPVGCACPSCKGPANCDSPANWRCPVGCACPSEVRPAGRVPAPCPLACRTLSPAFVSILDAPAWRLLCVQCQPASAQPAHRQPGASAPAHMSLLARRHFGKCS